MVWKDIKLPDGKILIPGMISHQTNVVEHPELVAWRIKNFASVVGKENVIAGADCGFSQYWDSIRVHPTVQWAKLKRSPTAPRSPVRSSGPDSEHSPYRFPNTRRFEDADGDRRRTGSRQPPRERLANR